jgi:hypothetical protein
MSCGCTPGCDKTYGHVPKNFLLNAISSELTDVPGVTKEIKDVMIYNGISTTDHLVGQFFILNRSEVEFTEFLEDLGIHVGAVKEISENISKKFSNM